MALTNSLGFSENRTVVFGPTL
ncbi:hypothetical protein AGR7A_Cc50004 [Agrobacterium deltaense NCPPB 1641]|uniref:Uncharacterized protein n=1 Tax=Agrobacterium deltaense NCPPB 1641 TaxID=1183425 RepID=A0A1S7TRF5_9HYPH|nr:hypothetical protein AGR7A_Cc50004 [Agrobacterium deltaense NCPPB 1641]